MADAIGPANIRLNLATEEFRTCGRNNTVDGEVLEYLWPVSAGISGESTAAAAEGPWSSLFQQQPPGALTKREFAIFGVQFSGGGCRPEGPWSWQSSISSVQGLSPTPSPSRTSQTDLALTLYIERSIVNFDDRDNAPSFGCPVHHSQACIPWNAAAYADEPGTEA
jgi:hypothetical protein